VDQNGALNYGELHAPLVPDPYNNPNAHAPTNVSPLVLRAIGGEGEGATQPATRPTTAPVAQTSPTKAGGYEVIGTVIMTVNGTPIYADQVLAAVDTVLAVDARKYPPDRFRAEARNEISKKVEELRGHHLEIAAANKYLAAEDKTQADMAAQVYRRQLITEAGGSIELARQRALENGHTLDEAVQERYNLALVGLYYQKRIVPKIHITADDMRRYYRQHVNDPEFTQHAQAHFRLIKIDVEKSGGMPAAVDKANRVLKELKGGADFADLASRYNDDPVLMKNGGDEGWVNKGDFAREKVEQAVWALQPGEYTDHPIDEGSAVYLAKLEARKPGLVKAFDSEDVQRRIHEALFGEQFSGLRDQVIEELKRNAVYVPTEGGMNTAVDMAMQRYALWTSAR
jgi:parvulin-like peptidyl-prolyl isomerase